MKTEIITSYIDIKYKKIHTTPGDITKQPIMKNVYIVRQ